MNLETIAGLARLALQPVDRPPPLVLAASREAGPNDLYYRFLYLLSTRMQARTAIEIGTYRGASSAHLAGTSTSVVTIDLNVDAARYVREIGVDRVTPITANSGFVLGDPVEAAKIRALAPYDILYIDGDHTFNSAYGDYTHFWPLVREGGVIVFDDTELGMAGDEMRVFWSRVVDQKVKLNALHETGFGAAIRGSTPPPSWDAVIADVTREILSDPARAPRAPTE